MNSYHFHESKNNIKRFFIAFLATKDEKGFLTMAASLFRVAKFMCKQIDFLNFYDSNRESLVIPLPAGLGMKKSNLFILHSFSWMFVSEIWFLNHQIAELIFGCYRVKVQACCIQFPPLLVFIFVATSKNIKFYKAKLKRQTTKNRKFTGFRQRITGF